MKAVTRTIQRFPGAVRLARGLSRTVAVGAYLGLAFVPATPGLHAQSAADVVGKAAARMASIGSFAATVQIQRGEEAPLTGRLKYRSPGQLFVEFPNGKILATNGSKLWLHTPIGQITGEQDVKGYSGGIGRLVGGLNGVATSSGGGWTVKLKSQKPFRHVVLQTDQSFFVKKVQLLDEDGGNKLLVRFSNVNIGLGFPTTTFSYHPGPDSKTIINPLNFQK